MTKIWAEVFWKEAPAAANRSETAVAVPRPGISGWLLIGPIVSLAGVTITIGLAVESVYVLAIRAAEQLMDPTEYIQRVMERSF